MKQIKNPNDIVGKYVEDQQEAYGSDLLAILMYGSAVTHEYDPKKSDINIAIILKDFSIETVSKGTLVQKKWNKKGIFSPFYMTKEFIASSTDSYPLEFLDMRENYRVLYGEDVLNGLEIMKEDVRVQCERQLKGIALHLRRMFMSQWESKRNYLDIFEKSMKDIFPVMKGLIFLYNEPIPNSKSEIIAKVEDLVNLGASSFSEVFNIAIKATKIDIKTLLDKFCRDIDKTILVIDAMGEK